MKLSVTDFEAFHREVHENHPPFEWQVRLLGEVVENRRWPRTINLPTGTGKTTCVDIALFALALDATNPPEDRWCPRRIVMVVDRRVVVDQAADRGRRIREVLRKPRGPVAKEVAVRLSSLGGRMESPIGVFTLRGGIPRDDTWARAPDQPLILTSTVDQFGSRLLVQGYGVSDSMRPVHAGLLGNDVLVFLDEVHLSQPFAETLDALEELRSATNSRRVHLPRRVHHVFLSATPGLRTDIPFALTETEREKTSSLGTRLHASKRVQLVKVRDRQSLHETCIDKARELIGRHSAIAVILNRVASARTVADALQKEIGGDTPVVLLTGRMRPLERDDIVRSILPRVAAVPSRDRESGRIVVVGTQCIEVGADFDFDAMVSESASLDSLKQRFGRVDRLGKYGKAEGVIIHVALDEREDPIYGETAASTFNWLTRSVKGSRKKTVDFGTVALPRPTNEEEIGLLAPHSSAPILLPAYLDIWMQTSPCPAEVPDVSLWLHGPRAGPAEVQVVWRCDLSEEDLGHGDGERAVSIVASVRPTALEAISLPFWVAQRWLSDSEANLEYVADLEVIPPDLGEGPSSLDGARAIRWRGSESEVIGAASLRPGDTIVVPSTRGGITAGSFDPSAREPVTDIAERAALVARGRPLLRLHPDVLSSLGISLPTGSSAEMRSELKKLAQDAEPGWRKIWLQGLATQGPTTTVDALPPWDVVMGRRVTLLLFDW